MKDPSILMYTVPGDQIKHIEGRITWCYEAARASHGPILDINDPNLYDQIREYLDGPKPLTSVGIPKS